MSNGGLHIQERMKAQQASRTPAVENDTAFASLTHIETLRIFWKPILFCILASVSALNDSFSFAVGGNIVANQGFIDVFARSSSASGARSLDASWVSHWGGVTSAFLIIGHWFAGITADIWGRRINMYLQSLVIIASVVVEILARSNGLWLLARILVGFAIGMIQVNTTTYIAELAPPQVRGAMLAAYAFFFAFGQLAAAIALEIVNTNSPQRTPLKYFKAIHSQWALIGLAVICLLPLPESPWYYARKHDHERAKRTLTKINGYIPSYEVEREYRIMATDIAEHERTAGNSAFLDIFRGTNLRRTLAAVLAIASQQILGTSIFFIYSTYFFQQAGLDNPFQSSLIIYVLLCAFILVSFYTTECVGRRNLLLWGCSTMAILNIALGITGSVPPSGATNKAALAIICLWVIVYASTSASVGFVCAAEMATPRLRSRTNGFAISIYGIINLIFTFCIPLFLANPGPAWGTKSGFLFGGLTVIATVLIYFVIPETANRTFRELDELFESGVSVRKFKRTKTRLELAGGENKL